MYRIEFPATIGLIIPMCLCLWSLFGTLTEFVLLVAAAGVLHVIARVIETNRIRTGWRPTPHVSKARPNLNRVPDFEE